MMMMKLATTMLIGTSLPSANAWMTSPAATRRTETRLMSTRRSFFGAIATSTTTIIAAPWIAYANDEEAEVLADEKVEEAVESVKEEEPVLVAEESAVKDGEQPSVVELVADESSSSSPPSAQEPEIMEISNEDEQEEAIMALDAKIEESIETVEAAVEAVSEFDTEVEPAFVAMVDNKTKMFQDLFEERKAASSDDDMDAFRTKLKGLIAADATFVDAFESFLDNLTLASV
jgi:hypothetical protein